MATFFYEFDFLKGERGKFYRPDAELRFPTYLDTDVEYSAEQLGVEIEDTQPD